MEPIQSEEEYDNDNAIENDNNNELGAIVARSASSKSSTEITIDPTILPPLRGDPVASILPNVIEKQKKRTTIDGDIKKKAKKIKQRIRGGDEIDDIFN